ncbi:MAG TPA: hypothetical protein VMO17_00815 [Terriglobia bacterium]|nr:hypothetical protein [Terriglobia bacterium]
MGFWYYFWTINFLVAGSTFLVITLIVLVLGGRDLRDMFTRLSAHASDPPDATTKP